MDFFFKKKEQTSPARTTAPKLTQVAKKDIGTVGVGSEEEKKTASNNNNHSPSKKNSQNSKVFVLHARVVEGLDLVTSNDLIQKDLIPLIILLGFPLFLSRFRSVKPRHALGLYWDFH